MKGLEGLYRWTAGAAAVSLVLLAALGCENTTPTPREKEEITQVVTEYLHRLADCYTNMDTGRLEGVAAPGERAEVARLLEKLAQSGDRLEATLLRVELERIDVFRVVNATVRTLEVWEVRRLDAYTGEEKGSNPGSVQHALIQLRKIDGKWMVTSRRVQETQGGSPWKVATPTPENPTPGGGASSTTGAAEGTAGSPEAR